MVNVCWWFYFSKFIELTDTVSSFNHLIIMIIIIIRAVELMLHVNALRN